MNSYFTEDMDELDKRDYYLEIFDGFLNSLDFELLENKNNHSLNPDRHEYMLKDLQGGNLGNIEREVFYSRESIIERLDIYTEDSVIKSIEEYFPNIEYSNWEDLLCQVVQQRETEEFADCEFDIRILDLIIFGVQYID